jgi:hypothetical protein
MIPGFPMGNNPSIEQGIEREPAAHADKVMIA